MGAESGRLSAATVSRALRRKSSAQWNTLERINPLYVWILRMLYGTPPSPVVEIARTCRLSKTTVLTRRDEALHLLGFNRRIAVGSGATAGAARTDLQNRQKLHYLLSTPVLLSSERRVVELAVRHGTDPVNLVRFTGWTSREIEKLLRRLIQPDSLDVVQIGERARTEALRDLLDEGRNCKHAFEQAMLAGVAQHRTSTAYAASIGLDFGIVCHLTQEVRTELALCAITRREFRELQRRLFTHHGSGRVGISVLNSQLLPLYERFRAANSPFSSRERRYIRCRIAGHLEHQAGYRIFRANRSVSSIFERALLGTLTRRPMSFPRSLPLPPFTDEQNDLIDRLRSPRVSAS